MKYPMNSIEFERVEVFGKPAFYRSSRRSFDGSGWLPRIRRSRLRLGLRKPNTLERRVLVNHAGTVVAFEPLLGETQEYRKCNNKFNFWVTSAWAMKSAFHKEKEK